MDGDQNSSPLQEEFSWTSYPHIFFVKAVFVGIILKDIYVCVCACVCIYIYMIIYVCIND